MATRKPKKPVKKPAVKKLPVRKATPAEMRMIRKNAVEQPEEEEGFVHDGEWNGDEDISISDAYQEPNQIIVCASVPHSFPVGVLVGEIIKNMYPSSSYQSHTVDHNDNEFRYYSIFLSVN